MEALICSRCGAPLRADGVCEYCGTIYSHEHTKLHRGGFSAVATQNVVAKSEGRALSHVVGVIQKGARVEVRGETGNGFYEITFPEARLGRAYVIKDYFRVDDASDVTSFGPFVPVVPRMPLAESVY